MSKRRLMFDELSSPHSSSLRRVMLGNEKFEEVDMEDLSRDNHVISKNKMFHKIPSVDDHHTDDEACDSGIDSPENTKMDYEEDSQEEPFARNTARKYLFKQESVGVQNGQTGYLTMFNSERIRSAVEMMSSEPGLIGDGTRSHMLPTIQGRHKDLQCVTSETINHLLHGKYNDVISGYQIIDCRYPYEYDGGHIKNSANLHTEEDIQTLVSDSGMREYLKGRIIVFHCEFSSERGPKLLHHLRSIDRKSNSEHYPCLFYPEVYLLEGGYKAFYEQYPGECEPRAYLPMVHESYSKQLRHFRLKSKSWTAGDRQSLRRRRDNVSPITFEW